MDLISFFLLFFFTFLHIVKQQNDIVYKEREGYDISYQPIIKWSGSKRSQAKQIISFFPEQIETYYEPFIGGGSVLFQLMKSEIKVKNYYCSDINADLIALWKIIKTEPLLLQQEYENSWKELNKDENKERKKEYFLMIRDRFNKKKSIGFLFFESYFF